MIRRVLFVAALLLPFNAGALPIDLALADFDGNAKVVVIPLQFQDVPGVNPVLAIQNLFFAEGGDERSVRDYYLEASEGRIVLGGVVAPTWVTSRYQMAQYGNADSFGRDPTFDPLFPPVPSCYMALEAVRLADEFIDFSQHVDPFRGMVQIVIIHAGTAQDMGTTDLDIWSHMWSLCDESGNHGTFYADGVPIGAYMTDSEFSPIGTNVHELGHLTMGIPDLYLGPNHVRRWDLMASGSWSGDITPDPHTTYPQGTVPSHFGAALKVAMGWEQPQVMSPRAAENVIDIAKAGAPGTRVVRLNVETYACWTERMGDPWQYAWHTNGARYFLLEYRDPGAQRYDDVGPAGVVMWYVDECASYGSWWSANRDETNPRYRVIAPTLDAMQPGESASALSARSTTIGTERTGWFVEVLSLGETATVRVGNSDADLRLITPAGPSSVTTPRASRTLPVDDAPTVITRDSPIQFRVDGPGTWYAALLEYSELDGCTQQLTTVTCSIPPDVPPGQYTIAIYVYGWPTMRWIEMQVIIT